METDQNEQNVIDVYIQDYPEDVQKILQKVREVIKQAAPDAQETIKYGIPTFTMAGNLVHFGAYKDHIGFYPAPSGIEEFKEALSIYQSGKGTIRFPLDQPIPFDLIRDVVLFRVQENLNKKKTKRTKNE
ncbi:MAG: hypothetical protein CL609_25315 [Anaerolineaceae bacterium]|nr:hypothetical protein [Anaerolineaceae bacterium]